MNIYLDVWGPVLAPSKAARVMSAENARCRPKEIESIAASLYIAAHRQSNTYHTNLARLILTPTLAMLHGASETDQAVLAVKLYCLTHLFHQEHTKGTRVFSDQVKLSTLFHSVRAILKNCFLMVDQKCHPSMPSLF